MEAKELMIGDWVMSISDIDVPVKVYAIGQNFIDLRNDKVEQSGILSLCDFEPIPLTAKILEKNGFKERGLTIGNHSLFLEEDEKYHIHSFLWGGVFDGHINIEVFGNYACMRKKFSYVHELQQALRLCGLNELADNFKV